jgi:predicted DNA-binding transcriptional regulator YafY
MNNRYDKRDRTARLLNLELTLGQYPKGVDVKHLAEKCKVSGRTLYRDLKALEVELGVPIWEDRGKRGIVEGYFAPPINFSNIEAVNIFFATRMLHRFSSQSHANIISTYVKLGAIVPTPFKKYIQDMIEYLQSRKGPENTEKIANFDKLVRAWLTLRKVKINYQEDTGKYIYDRVIDIYDFEPIGLIQSGFIIAHCHFKKKILGLHFDQIVGEVEVLPDTYEIPDDFNVMHYLDSIWEYFSDEEVETIKLRFEPNIYLNKFHKEYYFQRSQQMEISNDGSTTMILEVRNSIYFRAWLMGWGSLVEVLEPKSLRNQMIEMHKSSLDKYVDNFSFKDITDDQWNLIKSILPLSAKTGRPRSNERQNINGILWVLRTGEKWSDIPQRYGSPTTCNTRLQTWEGNGIWDKMLDILRTR